MTVSKIKKIGKEKNSNNYMYFKVYGIFISLFSLCLTKWGENILFHSSFINLLIFYFSISFHILPFEKTTHFHHFFVVRRINYYCTLVNFQYFVKEILFLHFSWHLQKRHVSHWMQYIIINIFFSKDIKVNSISTCVYHTNMDWCYAEA